MGDIADWYINDEINKSMNFGSRRRKKFYNDHLFKTNKATYVYYKGDKVWLKNINDFGMIEEMKKLPYLPDWVLEKVKQREKELVEEYKEARCK